MAEQVWNFMFAMSQNVRRSTVGHHTSDDDDNNDDDDEDTGAQIAPIIKLEEVAVSTGEENEDVLLDLSRRLVVKTAEDAAPPAATTAEPAATEAAAPKPKPPSMEPREEPRSSRIECSCFPLRHFYGHSRSYCSYYGVLVALRLVRINLRTINADWFVEQIAGKRSEMELLIGLPSDTEEL
ncbi:hypothetical protein ACFE04_026962 [Oxalis oulophora]